MRLAPEDFLQMARPVLESGRAVSFHASGDSMRPFLRHGQEVVVRRRAVYRPGDIVLATTEPDGKVVMHYVAAEVDGRLELMGAANLSRRECCRRDDVVGALEEPRVSRRAVLLWHRLLPLRRLLLKLVPRNL